MRSVLLAAMLCATAPFARAVPGGDPYGALRDLDALVRVCDRGWYMAPEGPSPTLLRNRLLRRGETEVRDAARRAWSKADIFGTRAHRGRLPLREAILHLFVKPDPDGLPEGVLLLSSHPNRGGGPSPPEGTPLQPFEELVQGRTLRAPSSPSAAEILGLLVRLSKETVPSDSFVAMQGVHSRRICAAMALGEASAGDRDAERILVDRCRLFPEDPVALDAAGWCVAPATREYLRKRLLEPASTAIIARACGALAHHGQGLLEEAVEALPGEARDRVVRALGFGYGSGLWMGRVRAELPGATEGFLRALEATDEGRSMDSASVPDFIAMVAPMLADPDPAIRRRGEGAARRMFNSCYGSGLHSMSGCNDTDVYTTGAMLGPYPSEAHLVRALAEDLAAGRLRLAGGPPGLADPDPPGVNPPESEPRTDGPCPEPFTGCGSEGNPVHVSADWTEAGARVTIRNIGTSPFAVSPVTLRYCLADRATITIRERGSPDRSFRRLNVEPGHLGFFFEASRWCRVPVSTLVVLRPGGSWEWTIPVRPADRFVDYLQLDGDDRTFAIDGDPGMPVLRDFRRVYVRIGAE